MKLKNILFYVFLIPRQVIQQFLQHVSVRLLRCMKALSYRYFACGNIKQKITISVKVEGSALILPHNKEPNLLDFQEGLPTCDCHPDLIHYFLQGNKNALIFFIFEKAISVPPERHQMSHLVDRKKEQKIHSWFLSQDSNYLYESTPHFFQGGRGLIS